MYSLTVGLLPSLVLAGVALLVSLRPLHRSGRLSAFHSIGVGSASFAASFSVLNLALQSSVFGRSLLTTELANGLLALRVTSLTAAVKFVRLMMVGLEESGFEIEGDYYGADFLLGDQEQQRRKDWAPEEILGQATVLLLVLCLLWTVSILGRTSLLIALLSWAFAFTFDGFLMAAAYRVERKVQPPRFEAGLGLGWEALTVVLFASVMFEQFVWWVAFALLAVVLFLLSLPAIFDLGHSLVLFADSLGIMPPWVEEALSAEDAANADPTGERGSGVTAKGFVVRLLRDTQHGPGKVVILGHSDGDRTLRRFHVDLTQEDYGDAVRAHQEGLDVEATGILEARGTYRFLRPLRSFSVIPKAEQ